MSNSLNIFKYIDIFFFFAAKMEVAYIFSAKNVNAFAIFHDRNFNVMSANNSVNRVLLSKVERGYALFLQTV